MSSPLYDQIPRVRDGASQGTRGYCQGAGEEHLGLFVAHSAGEISVRGADAAQWCIQPPKGIARSTEAGCTARFADLRSRRQEDVSQRFAADLFRVESASNLGCGWGNKRGGLSRL